MSGFEPELGQDLFSNSPWQELPMQKAVEDFLLRLGEQISDRDLADGGDPMSNSGAQYETAAFKANAYCWCDGELHPEGCPPNFEWRDFRASWYKHAGRGNSQNRQLSPSEVAEMETECIASLPAGNPGGTKRRAAAFRRGCRMCECGHWFWMHLETGCDGASWEPKESEVVETPVGPMDCTILPVDAGDDVCPCQGFKLAKRRKRAN